MPEFDAYDVLEDLLGRTPQPQLNGMRLASAIRSCNGKKIPPRLLKYLCAVLEGRMKRRRGRKRKNDDLQVVLRLLAPLQYKKYLEWIQRREKTQGLKGWSCIRNADWWQESDSPHVRAAKMLRKKFFPDIDHSRVLNMLSEPFHFNSLYLL